MRDTAETVCDTCGAPIDDVMVGLSKKLINRGTKIFWCRDCLATMSGFPKEVLPDLVVRFRRMGCTLFAPWTEEDEKDYLQKQKGSKGS